MAKLIPDDGEFNDQFGTSVSIDGNHAIIGAQFHGIVLQLLQFDTKKILVRLISFISMDQTGIKLQNFKLPMQAKGIGSDFQFRFREIMPSSAQINMVP